MVAKLTDEQRRVLKRLRDNGPSCAKDMRTGIRTMMNLSRRGLIYVGGSFESVMYPQKARAEITDEGRAAIFTLSRT